MAKDWPFPAFGLNAQPRKTEPRQTPFSGVELHYPSKDEDVHFGMALPTRGFPSLYSRAGQKTPI